MPKRLDFLLVLLICGAGLALLLGVAHRLQQPSQELVAQALANELKERTKKFAVKIQTAQDKVAVGTGFIFHKNDDTYTIVTNEHVAVKREEENLSVVTVDGKEHEATPIEENLFGSKDIALLQFKSDRAYERGKLEQSLSDGDPIWAIGYPQDPAEYGDEDGFVTFQGQVLLQLKKPLEKGYAVGTDTRLLKGMSGGPLVNAQSNIVGIGGRFRSPILNPSSNNCDMYEYEDGSNVCDNPKAQLIQEAKSWVIPIKTFLDLVIASCQKNKDELERAFELVEAAMDEPDGGQAEIYWGNGRNWLDKVQDDSFNCQFAQNLIREYINLKADNEE